MLSKRKGSVFVVSAPAGTGKTTLVSMLTNEFPSVVRSISFTTRPQRTGEVQGVDYHFVSEEEFRRKSEKGDFIEHVTLYGYQYGTSKQWLEEQVAKGHDVVLVIDTQGALLLQGKIVATNIFVMPPTSEELEKRLKERQTESTDAVIERLQWASHELDVGKKYYDYLIINDNLDKAYQMLRGIVITEENREKPPKRTTGDQHETT